MKPESQPLKFIKDKWNKEGIKSKGLITASSTLPSADETVKEGRSLSSLGLSCCGFPRCD